MAEFNRTGLELNEAAPFS